MVTFELVSAKEVTINGVGLLKAGEPVQLDEIKLAQFQAEHGYPLAEANFPPYVQTTAVFVDDEKRGEV